MALFCCVAARVPPLRLQDFHSAPLASLQNLNVGWGIPGDNSIGLKNMWPLLGKKAGQIFCSMQGRSVAGLDWDGRDGRGHGVPVLGGDGYEYVR